MKRMTVLLMICTLLVCGPVGWASCGEGPIVTEDPNRIIVWMDGVRADEGYSEPPEGFFTLDTYEWPHKDRATGWRTPDDEPADANTVGVTHKFEVFFIGINSLIESRVQPDNLRTFWKESPPFQEDILDGRIIGGDNQCGVAPNPIWPWTSGTGYAYYEVTLIDFFSFWLSEAAPFFDFNKDGIINEEDYAVAIKHFTIN